MTSFAVDGLTCSPAAAVVFLPTDDDEMNAVVLV